MAEDIYRVYIDVNGKSSVNLSSSTVVGVKQFLNSTDGVPITVFDTAAYEISKLVELDGMARFVKTPRFKVETVVQSLGL